MITVPPMHPQSHPNERWVVPGICLFLVAIVWAVFGQTLGFGFVNFDDPAYTTNNPMVQKGVSLEGLRWAFTFLGIGHWHPLTWLTHMLDWQFHGSWAGGHHLTNVLLHSATAVCLFLVLRNLTGSAWRSAFVTAVWAIHPLRAESVAWVSERKDVLSALLFTLTLGAYARYARQTSLPRYLVVVALFIAGLLAKNMLVTLPCVLLLLDYWPLRRLEQCVPLSRLFLEKIPLFLLSAATCVVPFLGPEESAKVDRLPMLVRVENALVSYVIYLWQTVWPADLAVCYPNPQNLFPIWMVAGAVLLLANITAVAVFVRKSRPSFFVGWFWFAGMLVPVIGLVQIAFYAHADRYTNLPQIGLFLAVTLAVADPVERLCWPRWIPATLSVALIAVLAMTARKQVSYWHDSESLWNHTLACTDDNYTAYYGLGIALDKKGSLDEAIADYEKALEISPNFPEVHHDIGIAFARKGELDKAIAHFQRAIEIKPEYAEAFYGLGVALQQKGRLDEAVACFQEALKINPQSGETHSNLGVALQQKGRLEEAVVQYQKTIEIKPDDAAARDNLAWILATSQNAELRNGARAVELAQKADELAGGDNPVILGTLAAAYAEVGSFPKAVEASQKAIQLAESQGNSRLAGTLQERLKSYQAGQPLRDNR